MKRTLLFLTIVFSTLGSLTAQQFHIEKSIPFDEPEYGWNKILQLKNGYTFFFHAENKEGIDIVVYDKNRKVVSKKVIEGRLWDANQLKASKILGLYEISGEPVLFMVQGDDRVPTLYRMRFNPTNGAEIKEEVLGTLPKVTMGQGYAMLFGHVDPSDILVEKDPSSDCYAVIFFNGFAHDRSERIKVDHYDGTHKKINEAYYESPHGAYKYLRFISAVVDGNKRVFVTTYGYNTKRSGGDASHVIISKLNVGDTSFKHNVITFTEDFDDTKSVMQYNRNNNKLQLMTISLEKEKYAIVLNGSKVKSYYSAFMSYIDPETLAVTAIKPIGAEMVAGYAHSHIDKDYDFFGVPQEMVINKDNTTTVLMEEMKMVTRSYGRTTTQKTYLGPIGISQISDTGTELSGYAINKQQQTDGILPLLYLSDRSKGIFQPALNMNFMKAKGNTNQFMSFDYIDAPKGRYIIFNDLPANSDRDEDETKRKTVTSVSSTNTICYKLNDNNIDKSFLFGGPSDKGSSFSYIESSNYNRDVNTYATMVVERDGRDKQVRIAWVNFN